jgi:hypothetical protein
VGIDSFPYFGSDDLYLNYLAQFVKPGGCIGIAGAGLVREVEGEVPEHLRAWWRGYVRVVGRRRGEAKLEEYCWPDPLRSFPPQYKKKPLLRSQEL